MRPRVIPVLLLDGERLVKTTQFREPRYVGDPANVISIFNSFQVDEIVLLDISAERSTRGPQLETLHRVADEAMIPVAYGGGLSTVDQISEVLEIGFEKVVLNRVLSTDAQVMTKAADVFGSQAVVASIDARSQPDGTYATYVASGSIDIGRAPAALAKSAEELGAGEILITSIDHDGMMDGFDSQLIEEVTQSVSIPVIACGGAGRRSDLVQPIATGAAAVAAGSLFVFQGSGRGVLINYPTPTQLTAIFN